MNILERLPPARWNEETAAHLLSRAGFGGTPDEVATTARKGIERAVAELVDFPASAADVAPPGWAKPKNLQQLRAEARDAREEGDRSKRRELQMMENDEALDLRRWWLERMTTTPAPLLEKMTLFWHGHFATSVQKTRDGYWMWLQNDTLRRGALGNFAGLTKTISRDPAMMIYLDVAQSRREHPNENFARELMELFTVGIGNYTEQDVREAARCFTTYKLDLTTQQFRYAPRQRDDGTKMFLGKTGNWSGDDIIDMLVAQPAGAKFIGKKLLRFFVEDEPSDAFVDAIAASLRAHRMEIRPVLRELFASQAFYSSRAMGSQIKSPVQFIVQTCKTLKAPLPSAMVAQNAMRQMGQILFAPPNVKGWDGGKTWITSSTLLFRYNFANYLINGDRMQLPGGAKGGGPGFRQPQVLAQQVRRDPIDVSQIAPAESRSNAESLVRRCESWLFRQKPDEKQRNIFVEFARSRLPDTSDDSVRALLHLMMSTPQFQLA